MIYTVARRTAVARVGLAEHHEIAGAQWTLAALPGRRGPAGPRVHPVRAQPGGPVGC
ncbi:hypothetical protein FRACA_4960003 [Frankia canadensis]|uniref:Uncharacterized protein n=1 Tax=Frankia canadensis TaxID=1836972 RepID=A0A2I2KY67_9ACTN|nr:hypothetical protein FRACA_4960003 [Frankia canadensis]SOU57901.1 hypothetical protein FRACA_4960003 [Frankia canadensis]